MTFTLKSEDPARAAGGKEPVLWPERIACLTAETTEIVFALGLADRVVGVSGYALRPPEARKKEKIAAFTSVRMEKIQALKPDLILGFSDLQKDIARELVAESFNVFITNQRSLSEIGDMILAIGRLTGCEARALKLRQDFFDELGGLPRPRRGAPVPRVYFEEWDDPLISGISWVSELIDFLGGEDVFKEKSAGKTARERTVTPEDVIDRKPDILIASWCGKKVSFEKIRERPGWDQIPAVQRGALYEIKSPDILAPGLSLLEGARQMSGIFAAWGERALV